MEKFNFKGHFKIEMLDKNRQVIDVYEDPNLIMTLARTTMSEIFTNLNTGFVNKFVIGTNGHIGTNLLTPKTANENFVDTRTTLFSTPITTPASPTVLTNTIAQIYEGDIYYVSNATVPGYYEYVGAPATNLQVTQTALDNAALFVIFTPSNPTMTPYQYAINFTIPGTNNNITTGDPALIVSESDSTGTLAPTGSIVNVLHSGTSTTFNIELSNTAGNGQNLTNSAFTEAALFSGNNIFSMKTFVGKIKDNTTTLRVAWTITF